MILALGARGPEFDSPNAPYSFFKRKKSHTSSQFLLYIKVFILSGVATVIELCVW
ncbi:hypothetical protein LINGRAHAP2_LOCUS35747 [Linum grandiflorum]